MDEALWPPGFVLALTHKLASELAVPVRDEARLAEAWSKIAEMSIAKARHQNATEEPQVAIPTGRFAARKRR